MSTLSYISSCNKTNGGLGTISSFMKPFNSQILCNIKHPQLPFTRTVSVSPLPKYSITQAVTAWQSDSMKSDGRERVSESITLGNRSITTFMNPKLTELRPKYPITQAITTWLQSNNIEEMQSKERKRAPLTFTNVPKSTTQSPNTSMHSSREEKLMRWVLTSHNMYGFVLTVMHNFFDICIQKPEDKNFINDSLVPRIRYTGFTISAAAGVVYHVAIGVLFTPFVAVTLGQKESVNDMWYGYWAGASISAMGVFAGMFGMISGNYLIHKTMEKSIPSFKNLVGRYLLHIESRLKSVDIPQLRQEVESVKNAAEMFAMLRRLSSIARDLLPTIVWQKA
ncbi:MAG: hypothetical protein ACRCU0_04825 [Candidatus Rhabdochlamydia sp.]